MNEKDDIARLIHELIPMGRKMDAGSVKSISRKKKDGTPILAVCVYYECDELEEFLIDLEKLEEKHGYGE